MPLLDVTDILSDPDIGGEQIVITRARRTVSTSGRTSDSPYTIVTYGNVQPASGSQLEQFPEEQRVGSFMTVFVPVPLIPLSSTNAPDLVAINGQQYRVISAQDYSNYGQGFYRGICQLVETALGPTS